LTLFLPLENQFNRFQALPTIVDLSDRFFILTVASVWEEVFFRVLCLGIPLLGYHYHFVGNYAEVIISFVVSLLSDGNGMVSAGLLVLGVSFICMMIITGVWVTGNYCMGIIEFWKKRTRTKKPELPRMK